MTILGIFKQWVYSFLGRIGSSWFFCFLPPLALRLLGKDIEYSRAPEWMASGHWNLCCQARRNLQISLGYETGPENSVYPVPVFRSHRQGAGLNLGLQRCSLLWKSSVWWGQSSLQRSPGKREGTKDHIGAPKELLRAMSLREKEERTGEVAVSCQQASTVS